MRKIREALRLKWAVGLSNRRIAISCGIGRPTVSEYLRRAESAGLRWPLPADLSDARLERLLFPPPPDLPAQARGVPDWIEVHRQLKRKGVTLFLLWQEYREAHPDGYQYSWFCEQYRAWRGKLDVVMRQDHHVQAVAPTPKVQAEGAVLITVRMRRLVLVPQQLRCHPLALELPMHRRPIRFRPRHGRRGQRRKQPPLQLRIVQRRR